MGAVSGGNSIRRAALSRTWRWRGLRFSLAAPAPASILLLLVLLNFSGCIEDARAASAGCSLVGPGGCRGPDWSQPPWPIADPEARTDKDCCKACLKAKGCTAFHLAKAAKAGDKKRPCLLFGHDQVTAVGALGGECYKKLDAGDSIGIGSGSSSKKGHGDNKREQQQQQRQQQQQQQQQPTEEQCRKFVDRACAERSERKNGNKKGSSVASQLVQDGNDAIERRIQEKQQQQQQQQEGKRKKSEEEGKGEKKDKAIKEAKATAGEKAKAKSDKHGEEKNAEEKVEEVKKREIREEKKQSAAAGRKENKEKAEKRQDAEKVADSAAKKLEAAGAAKTKAATSRVDKKSDKENKDKQKKKEGEGSRDAAPKRRKGEMPKYDPKKKYAGGKYLHHVGPGGCRGPAWNSAAPAYPRLAGRLTLDACADACARDDECTAVHVMKPGDDAKVECLLFEHEDVLAVRALTGDCYVLEDEPEGHEQVEDLATVRIDGPVVPVHLGPGMCRGPDWTVRIWPVVVPGRHTVQGCAEACARRKKCTAFDVSGQMDKERRFRCILYGHKGVWPASGVPGQCYTTEDRLDDLDWAFDDEDEEEEDGDGEEDDDEDEEDDGTKHPFHHVGQGMCRGSYWQSRHWPKVKGMRSLQGCANKCAGKQGCTAFDVSDKDHRGQFKCHLYGHLGVAPARGVPGDCYALGAGKKKAGEAKAPKAKAPATKAPATKAPSTGAAAAPAPTLRSGPKASAEEKQDDSDFIHLGSGLCRGPGWQDGNWPKDSGLLSAQECFKACDRQKGCKAFDLSPSQGQKKKQCMLFGHRRVLPATGLQGNCYSMNGDNEDEEDDDEEEDVFEDEFEAADGDPDDVADVRLTLLGRGACRGPGWQNSRWPRVRGAQTLRRCGKMCAATPGCTALHVGRGGDLQGKTSECYLFGHANVVPATALPGECYKVESAEMRAGGKVKGKAKGAPAPAKAAGKSAPKKKATKEPAKEKNPPNKKYKVPEFDPPKVLAADAAGDDDDDDEWLFEPPPPEVRSRDHVASILGLDESIPAEERKVTEDTLKALKDINEKSIKPLESIYKYRGLSNRHFGDPEIFNKPLIVLMGPWSGGKSTMINYLLGTEFTRNAFKAAAEPSPGFHFNLAMHGEREEELDGTELAAEWTFSSLQKFGQQFLKKLKGRKMPNKLLERATFAEIPGVLETGSRKIDRQYSFNDACQWFIDHADLILLVYDYAKLDIGPETEALLDQLKGRESQVRIILNKADEITAEELLKIQGNLVWNVSPLMASLEPPTLYAGSFWSRPYKAGAPKRLLMAQEQALLRDIRLAIDKRVDNRIATARRFAVRVRNHAKMVDCYLTTYHNHKSFFSDKSSVANDVAANPHKYHIYEGISKMTNISRYDLPDPQTYRDFFRLQPLYDFPTLHSTCTFFRGCPINKLDLAIAYELPELLTKFKRDKGKGKDEDEGRKVVKKHN